VLHLRTKDKVSIRDVSDKEYKDPRDKKFYDSSDELDGSEDEEIPSKQKITLKLRGGDEVEFLRTKTLNRDSTQ